MQIRVEEAFEVVVAGAGDAPVLLSCEHASEHMPPPWRWHPSDAMLKGTHWAYDLGAAELTRDLAASWGATAVLARFSRLLTDPNRPDDSPELIRARAGGQPVQLNAGVPEEERARRLEALWRPYHAAIDEHLRGSPATVLLAVHSFTPVYEGTPRHLEVGVLFDEEEALAQRVHAALCADGFAVELNEPYSGKQGLIYSADLHARAQGRRALEIEVRQDLAVDDAFRARLVSSLDVLLDAAREMGAAGG